MYGDFTGDLIMQKIPRHKSVYILPNLFTTASLFTGFLAMVWAAEGKFWLCPLAILFSALMDALDGKVARLTNTQSEFGVQYDSLADLVAFGAAPAFMMHQFALYQYGRIGIAVCFLFTVCSALRLARFNISTATTSKRFFVGLPTPAAGCTLACIILIEPHMPDMIKNAIPGIALVCTAAIGLLMVSRIRYASFKEMGFLKAHPFRSMVFVIVVFALVVSQPKLFGSLLLFGYILSGLVHTFIILPRRARLANRSAQSERSTERNTESQTTDNPASDSSA